jgi:ribosomal protein L29
MLKAEIKNLQTLSDTELGAKLNELEHEIFTLKLQRKTMQLTDTSKIKKAKHLLAFIKMLRHQRELLKIGG